MANSSLRFLLGFYPKTEEIEKKRLELIKEFEELNSFAKSDELARFEYLSKFINSSEFAEKKKYLKTLSYNSSEEKKKEDEYHTNKKSKDVRHYFKFIGSAQYKQFLTLDGSPEIAHFEALKAFIISPEYKKVEDYMNDKKKWQKSAEFGQEQEFKTLSKDPSFKNYFKFLKSNHYESFKKIVVPEEIAKFEAKHKYVTDYKKLHNSSQIAHFVELRDKITSPSFVAKKQEISGLKFIKTEEYKKLQEFKSLAGSAKIKDYYKMKASKDLSEFKRIDASNIISIFQKLEEYILSDGFKNRKSYLLDSKKWEKSEECKNEQEFINLKKSSKIIWYFKLNDSQKYNDLKTWKITFGEEFNSNSLDRSKWITRYFWGDALMNDSYALPGEKHLFTDAKNIEYNGSTVKLVTRNEKIKGKEWIPTLGFIPQEFDYTSALLSSGSSFRTKFGRIEAKIKLDASQGVFHAFWLSGNTMLPQIDIFKFYNNKLLLSSYSGKSSQAEDINTDSISLKGSLFTNKFFIYSLEWTPEKLTWRINNLEVKTQSINIPSEEMYITINSGVTGDQNGQLPSNLEIDWIRCYQKV